MPTGNTQGARGCSALSRGILGESGGLGVKVEATGKALSRQSCVKRGVQPPLGATHLRLTSGFPCASQTASHAPSCHRRSHLGHNRGPRE